MKLSVKQALNILNSANLEGNGYTADQIKYGIESGRMPIGFTVPGKVTEYYPNGKTTYVIESERLMKWIKGADIKTNSRFVEFHGTDGQPFRLNTDLIESICGNLIRTVGDGCYPVKETEEEILKIIN